MSREARLVPVTPAEGWDILVKIAEPDKGATEQVTTVPEAPVTVTTEVHSDLLVLSHTVATRTPTTSHPVVLSKEPECTQLSELEPVMGTSSMTHCRNQSCPTGELQSIHCEDAFRAPRSITIVMVLASPS
jgi:hypothetical protein